MRKILLALLGAFLLPAMAQAQAVVTTAPVAHQIFLATNGAPLASGCVTTSVSGSATPLASYVDSTGNTPNSNPIILGSDGGADIWLTNNAYRFTVVAYDGVPGNKCASGVTQYVRDGINPWQPINAASNLLLLGAASDPSGTAGELAYRTDLGKFRGFSTLWDSFVTEANTGTLSNKTLLTPVITGATTGTGVQGTDSKLLSSGTISASSGVTICTDANGGATTSNCGAGVAKFDQLNNTASIGTTTLYAVPASGAGTYRVTCFAVITQAATTSSTLPGCSVNWTDQDSSAVIGGNVTTGNTTNTVGTYTAVIAGPIPGMEVKASTNITFNFSGYASSGATPMAYSVHVKLEYLGQ